MLPLPPPPQLQKQTTPAPLNQILLSKQSIIKLRRPRRTNPVVWCCSVVCLLLSLLLIFFGVATLIIFIDIKPRNPSFDTPGPSLGSIYFDSPEYFNGDFTFIANFSNPNRKITVRFEYVDVQLYFHDKLIATQALQHFTQKPGETRLESVHLISSLVYLPHNIAGELQKQAQSYSVTYYIQGNFKVKASLGVTHFSYWLHGRCQLEMTGPPTSTLVTRSCKTKR
ncbi:uncharacterized protein LOC131168148 [Malania oleifera]|uniref:uncharacterized protein LOC131168148 n=1 Tax=Malania oleifera TaxID=397392 RepID=UPI0025AE958E|nr:uncharacterized protein LOC131168148 [Malania oleifera]